MWLNNFLCLPLQLSPLHCVIVCKLFYNFTFYACNKVKIEMRVLYNRAYYVLWTPLLWILMDPTVPTPCSWSFHLNFRYFVCWDLHICGNLPYLEYSPFFYVLYLQQFFSPWLHMFLMCSKLQFRKLNVFLNGEKSSFTEFSLPRRSCRGFSLLSWSFLILLAE